MIKKIKFVNFHGLMSCAVPLSDAHCRLAKVVSEQEHENIRILRNIRIRSTF